MLLYIYCCREIPCIFVLDMIDLLVLISKWIILVYVYLKKKMHFSAWLSSRPWLNDEAPLLQTLFSVTLCVSTTTAMCWVTTCWPSRRPPWAPTLGAGRFPPSYSTTVFPSSCGAESWRRPPSRARGRVCWGGGRWGQSCCHWEVISQWKRGNWSRNTWTDRFSWFWAIKNDLYHFYLVVQSDFNVNMELISLPFLHAGW